MHILPEEKIAHRRVAHDHHLVDRFRIDGELFDGVACVARQRPHQQLAGVIGVVGNARHDFRPAKALRILKRSVRDQLAAFQIDQPQDNGRRPQIHGDAVNGSRGALHFDAVDEDAVSVARDRRIEFELVMAHRQPERLPLDAHVSAPHGVAANVAGIAVTYVWQESRKLPFRCSSGSASGERAFIPSTTSTMHSLHLPCLRHEVGTSMPSASAWSKSDSPRLASVDCPLIVRVTAIRPWVPTSLLLRVPPSMLPRLRSPSPRVLPPRSTSTGQGSRRQSAGPAWRPRVDLLHKSVVEHHRHIVLSSSALI